jgi:tetratricopeptide (TPR) repeat protein
MATNTNKRKKIFLSYCHANSDLADRIDADFQAIGVTFQRDIRDVSHGGSFKAFMNSVAKSDFVIVLVSKEYLRSRSCMYEIMEVLNAHEFEKKILPVLLDSAKDIFVTAVRKTYYDFWDSEQTRVSGDLTNYVNEDILEEKKRITNINENIGEFFQKLKDMRSFPFDDLKNKLYQPVLKRIGFKDAYMMSKLVPLLIMTDSEEKEVAIDEFLQEFPDNEIALFQKAFAAAAHGQLGKARTYYEKVLESDADNFQACNNLAIILAGKYAEFDKAFEYLDRTMKRVPLFLPAFYNAAYLLEDHLKRYDDARICYEHILKHNPGDAKAHVNLGTLLEKHFGDTEGARHQYELALKLDPDHPRAHYFLALLCANSSSELESAKEHFELALKADSEFYNAHYDYAILLSNYFDDFDGAIRHFTKVTQIEPRDGGAFRALGMVANKVDDYKLARISFERAIEIDPADVRSRMELARLLFVKFKDYPLSLSHYMVAREQDPSVSIPDLDALIELLRTPS